VGNNAGVEKSLKHLLYQLLILVIQVVTRHQAEHCATDDDIVEMRDQEQAIVQLEVSGCATMARISLFSNTDARRSFARRTATSTITRAKSSAPITWLGNNT
jgi:hypothetical protein